MTSSVTSLRAGSSSSWARASMASASSVSSSPKWRRVSSGESSSDWARRGRSHSTSSLSNAAFKYMATGTLRTEVAQPRVLSSKNEGVGPMNTPSATEEASRLSRSLLEPIYIGREHSESAVWRLVTLGCGASGDGSSQADKVSDLLQWLISRHPQRGERNRDHRPRHPVPSPPPPDQYLNGRRRSGPAPRDHAGPGASLAAPDLTGSSLRGRRGPRPQTVGSRLPHRPEPHLVQSKRLDHLDGRHQVGTCHMGKEPNTKGGPWGLPRRTVAATLGRSSN